MRIDIAVVVSGMRRRRHAARQRQRINAFAAVNNRDLGVDFFQRCGQEFFQPQAVHHHHLGLGQFLQIAGSGGVVMGATGLSRNQQLHPYIGAAVGHITGEQIHRKRGRQHAQLSGLAGGLGRSGLHGLGPYAEKKPGQNSQDKQNMGQADRRTVRRGGMCGHGGIPRLR